jgi:hypothetical protein
MRGLSDSFMEELKFGFLSDIPKKVRKDKDLDLQIRENCFNIYYKGNALLRLEYASQKKYRVDINDRFKISLNIPDYLVDIETTQQFLSNIPTLKENINKEASSSLEAEYEQEIIRANNYEKEINSEYFVVDRQYVDRYTDDNQNKLTNRLDLTGFFWNRRNRKQNQIVPLCFMEIKYSLNRDIGDVHKQIRRYYQSIEKNTAEKAKEAKKVFGQKLELNLINHRSIEALKTLSFSEKIGDYQFIIILVDYNPYSRLLKDAINE